MSQSDSVETVKSLLERSLALKAFPPLAQLDERVLTALASHAELRRVRRGAYLAATAPAPRALRLVVSGCLHDARRGARYRKHQLVGGPQALAFGDFEGALLAESDVVLLELEDRWLEALFEDEFTALEAILRGLARALLDQQSWHQRLTEPAPRGPMGLVERVRLLRACPGLGALGIDILADLGLEGEHIRLRQGEAWDARHTSSYAALLVGELRDASANAVSAPSLVGWLGALADESRGGRLVARRASELMVFDSERFWDRLEDHPDQGVTLVRALARLLD